MKFLGILIIIPLFVSSQTNYDDRIIDVRYAKKLNQLLTHSVPEISCKDLSSNFEKYILLDTRNYNEYNISHLKNAIWVGYRQFDISELDKISKDRPIVCYCSVGYRSEKIAQKLIRHGFKNVQNLYGSLFEWANQNLPIYNNQHIITDSIHGYNRNWSQWISNQNIKIIY